MFFTEIGKAQPILYLEILNFKESTSLCLSILISPFLCGDSNLQKTHVQRTVPGGVQHRRMLHAVSALPAQRLNGGSRRVCKGVPGDAGL